jgi:hypothetical protein
MGEGMDLEVDVPRLNHFVLIVEPGIEFFN